ncbi:MAG: 2-oxoacid:acceptor oxidoreductase family protein [Halanaerobiales bacterium]|nr:2-oxoacid:acceptor oxidoreductase family protein [Halanaerobiales bacterium]
METRMLFAGFGGQGLLFMGKVLAYAGMLIDKQVTWIPSYGPEMRGGTANCSVIISDEEIASPLVNRPDILVAMNQPSLDKFVSDVKDGGLIIVNSSIIKDVPELPNCEVIQVPANDLAMELGNVKSANMVVMGVLLQKLTDISKEDVFNALAEIVPAGREKILELNKKAIEIGLN